MKSSELNNEFYEAINELIKTEESFIKNVSILGLLCSYKLQKINEQNSSIFLGEDKTCNDLINLIFIMDILALPISELEDYFEKKPSEIVNALNYSFTQGKLSLKYPVFLFYTQNYQHYNELIHFLFKNNHPKILYELTNEERHLENINLLTSSYRDEGYEITVSELYKQLLAPLLSSCLISPVQRYPRYFLLVEKVGKYAPPELISTVQKIKCYIKERLDTINATTKFKNENNVNFFSTTESWPTKISDHKKSINIPEHLDEEEQTPKSPYPLKRNYSDPEILFGNETLEEKTPKSPYPLKRNYSDPEISFFVITPPPPPKPPTHHRGQVLFPKRTPPTRPQLPLKKSFSNLDIFLIP